MERVVYKNVYNYLVRNKLIYEYQSGFLELILCIKPLCQTLSKALEKSQNKKQLNSFFSSELSIELYSSINWWIVECFGRKPD
jgi:hypothetical protein